MKLALAFAMIVFAIAQTAWAQPQPASDDRPLPGPFRRFDANGDGKLQRAEMPRATLGIFDRIDADRDGVVTLDEHFAFQRRAGERQPDRPDDPQRPPLAVEGVRIERDLPYANTDNPRQRLDLALPARPASDKLPVVAWIHGGAWLGGSKDGGLRNIEKMVASGEYAAASIGYRLTGEAIWPAQIHDCKAAIRWLRANAQRYGLDPERIGVWGSSAGGHLVAMLGTSGGVAALEGDLGEHSGASSRVQCVVDYFGPSDLLAMPDYASRMDHASADSPESRLIGGAIREHADAARAASPITYISADDPPILVVHGTDDSTVPFNQGERFAKALTDAGVPNVFIAIEGGGHGGFRNPELMDRVQAFFDKHLRNLDREIPGGPISNSP